MTRGTGRVAMQIILLLCMLAALCVGLRMAWGIYYRSAYPVHYRELVEQYSRQNGLPPSLVFAVIRTESGFDPHAQSIVEARGLMQITRDTFEWAQMRERQEEYLEFDMLFNGEINIQYGTVVLRLLLEEFESEEVALCAYHAGWGNVKRWLRDPELTRDGVHVDRIPFRDTAYYVDRVLETQQMYERLYSFEY